MDETTTTSIGLCGNKIEFSDRDWNKIDRVEFQFINSKTEVTAFVSLTSSMEVMIMKG